MKEIIKCFKCKNEVELNYNKIHQDISGKFIVCEKCKGFINVEPKKVF